MTAEEFIRECAEWGIPIKQAENYINMTMQDCFTEYDVKMLRKAKE